MATAKRMKQQFLPKMKPLSNAKIDAAADEFYDAERERKRATAAAKDSGNNLLFEMRQAKVQRYECPDGKVVTLEGSTKVKVSRKLESGEEAE